LTKCSDYESAAAALDRISNATRLAQGALPGDLRDYRLELALDASRPLGARRTPERFR